MPNLGEGFIGRGRAWPRRHHGGRRNHARGRWRTARSPRRRSYRRTHVGEARTEFVVVNVLQFAGAGYLIYFGARIISSSFRAPWRDQLQAAGLPSFRRRLVLQALVIQVTNPKALLFVSALLPQFLGANEHIPLQLAALLICTVLVDAFVLGSYAFLVGRGVQSIRSRQLSRWIERAFGVALVSFGITLLVWRR